MKKLSVLVVLIFFTLVSVAQEKTGWEKVKSNTTVFGEVFGDYYYMLKGDTLQKGNGEFQKKSKGDNGFTVRRFYLGVKYDFNKTFSAKLMFEGNDGNLLPNGKRSVNIKYAYVKWKNIFKGSDLIIGAQSTPTWSRFTEKIWGYRSVEKTILDYWKQGLSNDLGISLTGRLDKKGNVHYNLMIGNGAAQKPEADIYKKFYGSVNARLFNRKFLLELYGDIEPQPQGETKYTVKGFVGYQTAKFTAGLEPFIKGQKKITGDNIRLNGGSLFARGTVVDKSQKLFAFSRVDLFKNANNVDRYMKFWLIGLDYSPVKGVHLIPNVWFTSYNFYTNAVLENGTDVVARITFWFKFN